MTKLERDDEDCAEIVISIPYGSERGRARRGRRGRGIIIT